MPRFRTVNQRTVVVNRAGGEAFEQSPKLALVSILLTSFVKDKFYESEGEQLNRLTQLIRDIKDKQFVAKAGIYARTEFGMRSITHALAGELAHEVKGAEWTKDAIAKMVYRPDDMMEILGYYQQRYGEHPIPNCLKKAFAIAINKFDEYQLAKYRGDKSSIKLVDIVNLVHPKVKPELQPTIDKLVKGQLKSTDTWESQISAAGQAVADIQDDDEKAEKLAELKNAGWSELVRTGKIGYFALLRNLRNIMTDAPDILPEALTMLTDEIRIRKSLVLPFRFSTALKQFEYIESPHARKIVQAISKAVDISLSNVPELPGRTLIALDESGSMAGKPIEIGSLFAAILYKRNDAMLLTFSYRGQIKTFNPMDSTLTIARQLESNAIGGGTNFHSIFATDIPFDRIIILSDMQGWINYIAPTGCFADYKRRTNTNPHLYSFDLSGYGDMQFPEKQVYCIAGFSEKVFDLMKVLETDKQALISTIDAIEITPKPPRYMENGRPDGYPGTSGYNSFSI